MSDYVHIWVPLAIFKGQCGLAVMRTTLREGIRVQVGAEPWDVHLPLPKTQLPPL